MPKTYTVNEVADILGYSTNSIYTFLKEKRIKGVRVGKGRFRIPEEELSRILHLSKKSVEVAPVARDNEVLAPLQVTTINNQTIVPPSEDEIVSPRLARALGNWTGEMNLFDWFISGVSIALASAMILVPNMMGNITISSLAIWMVPVCVTLGLSGLGLLVTTMMSIAKDVHVWRKGFLALLILAFGGYAYIHAQTGGLMSAMIFGAIAVSIAVTVFTSLSELAALSVCGIVLAVITPILVLGYPSEQWIPWIDAFSGLTRVLVLVGWEVSWSLAILMMWVLAQRGRYMGASVFSGIIAASFIMFAVYHAQNFHIGLSMLMFMSGVVVLVLPFWRVLRASNRVSRVLVFGTFGAIIVVLISMLVIVSVNQASVRSTAQIQVRDRLVYAQEALTNFLSDSKQTLESMATNAKLAEAVKEKDSESMLGLFRGVFESSRVIRRIVVLDKAGDLMSYYPQGAIIENANYANREYFIQALTKKQTYVSDVFTTIGVNSMHVMVVATPVYDSNRNVIAVLVGSLDINALQFELGKIAADDLSETFALADHNNRWIIQPDERLQFQELTQKDLLLLKKPSNVVYEGADAGGSMQMVAHTPVVDTSWQLVIRSSLDVLYRKSLMMPVVITGAFFLVCVIIAISVSMYSGFWWLNNRKHRMPTGGAP